jgi:hypothetical protein
MGGGQVDPAHDVCHFAEEEACTHSNSLRIQHFLPGAVGIRAAIKARAYTGEWHADYCAVHLNRVGAGGGDAGQEQAAPHLRALGASAIRKSAVA